MRKESISIKNFQEEMVFDADFYLLIKMPIEKERERGFQKSGNDFNKAHKNSAGAIETRENAKLN